MTCPTLRLADIDPEQLASRLVQSAVATITALSPGLSPLVRVQVVGPLHDLPAEVPPEQAVCRSWVYGCALGCDLRDLVLYAQGRTTLLPEHAVSLLTQAQLIVPAEGSDRDALALVALGVVGRVLLAAGGAVPPRSLAALAGIGDSVLAHLLTHEELPTTESGSVPFAEALRWLRARGVPGLP